MRKEFSITKPAILRLPSQTLPATLLVMVMIMVFSSSGNAQQFTSPPIDIKPSAPEMDYVVPKDLFPGESTDIQVNVTSTETHNEKEYTLVPGSPKIVLDRTNSIWATANQDGETSITFSILNAGEAPARHDFKVEATWSTTASSSTGGGGSGGSGDSIPGSATGAAYTKIPVFTWSFEPRLQFADNQTPITFIATTAIGGATLNLGGYTVEGATSWNIVSQANQPGVISGTVKSDTPSKGTLKIKYQGNDIDESADEIAFAKVDLDIASIGTEADLAEDIQPGGGAAPSPHEMDPGGIVIAPIQGSSSGGKRTKLTLTGNGNSLNQGTYALSSTGASKLKIYEAAEGVSAITLPKNYSASELSSPKTLYVGSDAFGPNDQTQTGTITLTYKLPLQAGGQTHEIKDEVKVSLLPVEVVVRNESETDTPPDGLSVVEGESITFDFNGRAPAESFPLPQSSIDWQTRQMKQNGNFTSWISRGSGCEYTESWELPGIFQLKAILTLPDGSKQEFTYVRKKDAKHADNRDGDVQDIHKLGSPDYFGITSLAWQSELRSHVVKSLGDTGYAQSATVSTNSFGFDIGGKSVMTFGPGTDKCNLFVYHKANDIRSAPHVALTRGSFGTSPPLAIDWWNDNSGRKDNKGRVITTVAIPEWSRLSDSDYPQPGFISSRADLDEEPEQYHSHCGILDYDGSWISAGSEKVNKYCHILTPAYQPLGLKK